MAKNGSDDGWIGIIICFVIFWPLGLFLLFRKLANSRFQPPSKKTLNLIGGALAIWGLYKLTNVQGVQDLLQSVFYLFGGCAIVGAGFWARARERLYKKYRAIVGNHPAMSIESIAKAIPTGLHSACRDLQRMIDKGMLGDDAYIDMNQRRLVVDSAAYQTIEAEFAPEPQPEPQKAEEPMHFAEDDEYEAKLREIRRLNDDIENEAVSADIARIESLTASIFTAVRGNPEKRAKINTFMNYYLPTTLKLLTAYAQLEDQPAGGRNVKEARANIESILKRLVECFEQLLDQLYGTDVIDITSDIKVLETMMAKDGMLTGQYSMNMDR